MTTRTLKNGRLFILKDGSSANSFAATAGFSGGWFRRPDGTWSAMVQESSGFVTYTGGTTPCAIKSGTGALETAGTVAKPVFYEQGATIHHWFANNEGAGAFDLRYEVSTNGGASFSSRVDLDILGDQAWCNDAVWPLYFDFERDGTDNHRLWVIGRNGAAYTVGYIAINTVGTFATEIADPASYTLQASASISHDFDTEHVAMTEYRGRLLIFHTGSPVGTIVRVMSSADGVTWTTPEDENTVLAYGVIGTADDAYIQLAAAVVHQETVHLMYMGNDGVSNTMRLAVGESSERLSKVPWLDIDKFGGADVEVGYSGELSFNFRDQHVHVADRGKPGHLSESSFQPFPVSFNFRQDHELSSTDGAFGWLADLVTPRVGEDQVRSIDSPLGRLSLVYVESDETGNPDVGYLLPNFAVSALAWSEGEDATTITASGECHSTRWPLWGKMS